MRRSWLGGLSVVLLFCLLSEDSLAQADAPSAVEQPTTEEPTHSAADAASVEFVPDSLREAVEVRPEALSERTGSPAKPEPTTTRADPSPTTAGSVPSAALQLTPPPAPISAPLRPLAPALTSGRALLIHGLRRTRESTVRELLPRQPPALYSDAELIEIERRIGNLGIFDHVAVTRVPEGVQIDVREKWTLIPSIDFARGKTFRDTFLLLGATEYNFLGTASQVSATVYHEERGWNGAVSFGQHGYHPGRGALLGKFEWSNSSYRFEGSAEEWYTRAFGGGLAWSKPLVHGSYFTYEVVGTYQYELVDDWTGAYHPPSGHSLLGELNFTWDHYRWSDLAPRGYTTKVGGVAGGLAGSDVLQARVGVFGSITYAIPIARYTSLMGRLAAEVLSRGNANFSVLLGGLEGVRGLDDALYRNWAQGYTNLELRQSIPLFSRLAMQLVAFTDGAVYQQLDAYGRRAEAGRALSAGMGGRLIPTFLTEVLFRIDVARLLVPYREWFVQWGLSQYF